MTSTISGRGVSFPPSYHRVDDEDDCDAMMIRGLLKGIVENILRLRRHSMNEWLAGWLVGGDVTAEVDRGGRHDN